MPPKLCRPIPLAQLFLEQPQLPPLASHTRCTTRCSMAEGSCRCLREEVKKRSRFGGSGCIKDVMTIYAFGPFILDATEHRLTHGSRRIAVPGKAWQILLLLVEAGGRLVSHETFRARLWPDVVVEDRTLTVHVSTLRKALGDGLLSDFIETVPRAGYRLGLPVRVLSGADPLAHDPGMPAKAEAGILAVRPFATRDLAETDAYLGVGIA